MSTSTLKPRAAAPRAPMPAPPVRQFSFTDFQVNNPTAPPPGDRLDAEFDRANTAIDSTITWASTSLNTDGSIRDGVIGQNQLVSGLFDDVAQGIIDEVQPMVDDAQGFANAAQASSATAQAAATSANTSNVAAQGAADDAQASASSASQASTSAQDYAFQAGTAASTAQNADNHATGEAAWASNYAVLAEAWAEHMPDPIPPNILATMGITGDHWSSRWWATKAEAALGGLTTTMYLGAWPTPPATTPTGDPITIGAIYYNTTSQQPFIWTGTAWVPFYTPVKSYLLTLLYRAAANQTTFPLTAPDLGGNTYSLSPATPEPIEAYVNGIRVPQDDPNPGSGDWTLNTATSTITFLRPLLTGSMVQMDIMAPASMLAPTRVQTQAVANIDIDPATGNPGQIDGVRTTFPLIFTDGAHTPVNPGSAQEMFISLDGVVQQPNIAYTVSAGNIVFTEPPALGAIFWGYWYGPGLSGTGPGAGFLPITGGTLTGPLTLAGPPSLALGAANKGYVDGLTTGMLPLAGGTMVGPLNVTGTGSSASRSVQDRFGERFDLRDFGAVGDGVADDTAAVQAWMNAMLAAPNGAVGYVPKGRYRLLAAITGSLPDLFGLTLRGDGPHESTFIGANATGAIMLTSAFRTAPLNVYGLQFEPASDGAGTALSYTVSEGGNQAKRIFTLQDCYFGPSSFTTAVSWTNCIVASGLYRPMIRNVMCWPGFSTAVKQGTICNVNGSYFPHIEGCYFNGAANYGVLHTSVGSEAIFLNKCVINGPDYGLWFQNTSGPQPGGWITSNHFNCAIEAIHIDGLKLASIRDNLFYCQSSTAGTPYIDINIVCGYWLFIEGNIYRGPAAAILQRRHVNLLPGGVLASPVVQNIRITDYIYAASTSLAPVYVGPNVTKVVIRQPAYMSSGFDFSNYPTVLFQVDVTATSVVVGDEQTMRAFDESATSNPNLNLYRSTKSPAANDVLGALNFYGSNASGADQLYTILQATSPDPTAGAQSGDMRFRIYTGGVIATEAIMGQGIGAGNIALAGSGTFNCQNGYFIRASGVNRKVIGGQRLGWTVPTGTALRTGFDTSTATLTQVAQTLMALIQDLHAATSTAGNGLIGT